MNHPHLLERSAIEALIGRGLPKSFPPQMHYVGAPALLKRRRVAIIGSRHPTFYGREQAAHFARVLASKGVSIVSGAAIGIDTIANTLAFHHGHSVAILGSGLGAPYPRSNLGLFQRMAQSPRGLILSEFEDHEAAVRWNFPRRNRVIAALCDFVLVIEAAVASGSMITAHLAAELGVDVGALPGPVHSATSQGSNQLIKQGAFCIESPEEVLERLTFLGHDPSCSEENSRHGIAASTSHTELPILDTIEGGSLGH